jgi:anti-sigma regulatory factor (Ser/Thr protein kinase)
MTSWAFDLSFQTVPSTLRTARKLASCCARSAGASEELAQDVELAVSEALANAQRHGYLGGIGPVDVKVGFDGKGLFFIIQDHGRSMPAPIPVPVRAPANRADGFGLYVIGQLMDSVEVIPSQRGDGTAVRMMKTLK